MLIFIGKRRPRPYSITRISVRGVRPDEYAFQRGLEDRPDESSMPLPAETPAFQRGVPETDDKGKYRPFSGLADRMEKEPEGRQLEVLPPESSRMDDGIDVGGCTI